MSNITKKLEKFKKDYSALKKSIIELEQLKEEPKNSEQPNAQLQNKLKRLNIKKISIFKNPFSIN